MGGLSIDIKEIRKQNKKRLANLDKSKIKITTYTEIEKFIKSIPNAKKYTGVYGVPRGGLIFATLFSYFYNVPLLQAPTKNGLVIDDDIGSGLTLSRFISKYDTAVMFSNKECKIKPTYIYQYYQDDEFRLFPWNTLEEFK